MHIYIYVYIHTHTHLYIYIYTHEDIYHIYTGSEFGLYSLEFRVTSLFRFEQPRHCNLWWQDVQMSSNGLIVMAPDSTTFRKGNGLR